MGQTVSSVLLARSKFYDKIMFVLVDRIKNDYCECVIVDETNEYYSVAVSLKHNDDDDIM